MTINETIKHEFERAGLGKAPFRCVGHGRETYQAIPGDPNCPLQPGAACDYCSTGIYDVYYIESADGKRFKVGSTCVGKTGDAKLIKVVKAEARKRQTELRHAREEKRVDEARELLAREDVREALRSQPHPQQWRAEKGDTKLDWAEWMMENAGTAGRLRVAKVLKGVSS